MESSTQELPTPLSEPTSLHEEGLEPPQLVTCNPGDDKIDPFLLSALNNPRDRLLLLKLDHELERFVNDPTKQRLEFPPMSSYQRLIVHRVAQYFLLDHAAVDVDNLKRAVVLFKSTQSRIPVLRLTDLREEPDAPPQKAVKIMRRAPNVSGRNYASSSGGSGDRAQTDKTLEERETEYAKARARIFNENPSSEKPSNNSTNNGSSDSNVPTTDSDANCDANNNTITNNNNNSTTTKDQTNSNDSGINTSQKRNTSTAPAKRRGFSHDEGARKHADASFSDMSFYSQDITPYRDKVAYNSKDQNLNINDGGFMMDGKDRMHPYPIGHFDPDGLFASNIDTYMSGLRFDGYDFSDYSGAQEVPGAWGMPPPHPGFYGFGRGGYADGVMGKGDNSFYFDFAPPVKEWTPPSMGGLQMNTPLSANATPFEPASHSQAHATNPPNPTNPTNAPNPTSPTSANGPSSNSAPSVINTNNTINTFNTINTYNTINNINTINIINTNKSAPATTPPTSSLSSVAPGARRPSNPSSTSPPLPNTSAISVPPSTSPTLPGTTTTTPPPTSANMTSRIPTANKAPSTTTVITPKPPTPPNIQSSTLSSTPISPPTSTPATTAPTTTTATSSSSPSTGRKNNGTRSATSPPSPPPSTLTVLPPQSHVHPRDSLSPPKYAPSTTPPFPRTTTPPPSSSQIPASAQQLPPPAQIPMQPPPIYRPFPPAPSQFGFDAGPWGPPHPYVPFPPTTQYHPLPPQHPPPHPLTHPHLYPPHPQFLPAQSGTFGNAAIYTHPFMGPAPMPKPIVSLDYERRPPKSTELFDPKAPPPPKRQQASSQQVEAGMRHMSLYPSPHSSPAQTHNPPNTLTQQGVKKHASAKTSQSPQLPHTQLPNSTKPSQTSPPPQPLHPKASTPTQPRTSTKPNSTLPSSLQPQLPNSALNPALLLSQDQAAPRLLYDYPQQQGVYVPPDHTPPPAVAHILEIFDFSPSIPVSPSPTFLDHPIFTELKKAGAAIKVLDTSSATSSVFIAIFKTGAAARKALESWGEQESERGCGYSLRQWAPAFISGTVSQPVPERESE